MMNTALVQTLAAARKGTFTGLIIPKVGVEVGGVRYGDDTVHTVIVTGFSYGALLRRSLRKLANLTEADLLKLEALGLRGWERVWKKSDTLPGLQASCEALGLDSTGKKADLIARLEAAVPGGQREVPVTLADLQAAAVALQADLQGSVDGTAVDAAEHVYRPLVVDGEVVQGARVYVGHSDPSKNEAPLGTIYLQGLHISSKVLVPAANGPAPASKSAVTTVAKEAIRRLLPISRYVSYRLDPDSGFILRAGGAAAQAADTAGVTSATPERVVEVMDLLAA